MTGRAGVSWTLVTCCSFLLLAACGGGGVAPPSAPPPAPDTSLSFTDNGCSNCHAADGSGGFGPDIRCITFARLDDHVRRAGTSHVGGAFPGLTDADLDDLVAFLGGPDCGSGTGSGSGDGLDCARCHVAPQDNGDGVPVGGRRAVLAEFGLASHHLDAADLAPTDCLVCHDLSRHMQGSVRLRNADHPDDATLVVALTGDPTVDAAEAQKLEPFCLACHDADAAAGSAPFGNGRTPPVVDAAAWNAGGHVAGEVTCMGDGVTFGCHTSAHGTDDTALLGAAYARIEQQAYGAGDDAACWGCHAENTVVTGTNAFEDLHDEHVREKGLACIDCHDTHGAFDAGERGLISFRYALDHGFDLTLPAGTTASSAFTVDAAAGEASCTLRCHGETHTARRYSFTGSGANDDDNASDDDEGEDGDD